MAAYKSSRRSPKLFPTTRRMIHAPISVALKGIEGAGKCVAKESVKNGTNFARDASLTGTFHSINYLLARSALGNRRIRRLLDQHDRLVQSGKQDSMSERIYGWAVDHLLFLLDVLLGFIGPIVRLILWSIFRLVVILMCNAIFFYALYLIFIAP